MPLESTIRDFLGHLAKYSSKLTVEQDRTRQPDYVELLRTRDYQLSELISQCSTQISKQIDFEKKLREFDKEINYPDD